jgi:LacI family transcriptional regulator
LATLFKDDLPRVLITREVAGFDFDFVGNDERLAMHLATRHLLDLGHEKIAFLGGDYLTSVARDRRAGFVDAMRLHGHQSPETLLFDCANNPSAGQQLMNELLQNSDHPSAIIGFSDQLALGVISSLLSHGLTPGKEISVVGCDDIEESGRIYTQLTTIHIQKYQLGGIAAELLQRRLQSPDLPIQRTVLIPELVIRKSSGPVHH